MEAVHASGHEGSAVVQANREIEKRCRGQQAPARGGPAAEHLDGGFRARVVHGQSMAQPREAVEQLPLAGTWLVFRGGPSGTN